VLAGAAADLVVLADLPREQGRCEVNAQELFFILSMERTREGQTCTWWLPDGHGYTASVGLAGRFTREEALRHSDPPHHLVIPCSVVEVPAASVRRFAHHALKESRFDAAKKPPTFLEQAAEGESKAGGK
jgi:hypothetical protein